MTNNGYRKGVCCGTCRHADWTPHEDMMIVDGCYAGTIVEYKSDVFVCSLWEPTEGGRRGWREEEEGEGYTPKDTLPPPQSGVAEEGVGGPTPGAQLNSQLIPSSTRMKLSEEGEGGGGKQPIKEEE